MIVHARRSAVVGATVGRRSAAEATPYRAPDAHTDWEHRRYSGAGEVGPAAAADDCVVRDAVHQVPNLQVPCHYAKMVRVCLCSVATCIRPDRKESIWGFSILRARDRMRARLARAGPRGSGRTRLPPQ